MIIDPEYDAYKRGAFLEKTNRFVKDKPSEAPGELGDRPSEQPLYRSYVGPGSYNTDVPVASGRPASGGQKAPSADRYAVLQRKLDDLERLHAEGKKAVSHTVALCKL